MESNNSIWSAFFRNAGLTTGILGLALAAASLFVYGLSFFKPGHGLNQLLRLIQALSVVAIAGLLLSLALAGLYGAQWGLAGLDSGRPLAKRVALLCAILAISEFLVSALLPGASIETTDGAFYAITRGSRESVSLMQAIALSWNRARFFAVLAGLATSTVSFLGYQIAARMDRV